MLLDPRMWDLLRFAAQEENPAPNNLFYKVNFRNAQCMIYFTYVSTSHPCWLLGRKRATAPSCPTREVRFICEVGSLRWHLRLHYVAKPMPMSQRRPMAQ